MSKFVVFAVLLVVVVCLAANASAQPQHLTANAIISRIIGAYEARIKGPSVIYPEQRAHVLDGDHLVLHI
ncbi:hypothetical protein DOY81_000410 [Sarcophaga bullata]|nr:hypothetical protein DOY81_000410 [Sarcophaga bullata]